MLHRFSLRQVIVGAMAALGLVAFAGVMAVMLTAGSMRRELGRQTEQLRGDEALARRIVELVEHQLESARRYAQTGESHHLEQFRDEGLAVYDHLRGYLFRELAQEERLLVERIRERHQQIEVAAQRSFERVLAGELQPLPGAENLDRDLAELMALRVARAGASAQQQREAWRLLYLALAALAALFLSALVAVTSFLRRRLLAPLDALAAAARRVGGGDFDARVAYRGQDELSAVAHSFNRMAERLYTARADVAHAERRFRDLVEGLSAVVWEAEADTLRCTYVSPRAEHMFGHAVSEWIGREIGQRVIHPEDLTGVLEQCRDTVRHRGEHHLEYRVVAADGAVAWVRDSVRVLLDDTGRPYRLRGVFTDITLGRTAAEALRESEERYHSLFQRVPIGLYRTSREGALLDGNAALAVMLGYSSREAMLSAADGVIARYLDPEERRRWQQSIDAAPGVVEVDREHRRVDGALIWVRDIARAVRDTAGNVLYYEGALKDVTERVLAGQAISRSEARFRSLIENASDGVLIVARSGELLYHSPAVERMTGYAAAELQNTTIFPLIDPDDRPRVRAVLYDLAIAHGTTQAIEFRCRRRDGGWRVLHATATDLVDDPAVGGIVINMIDATAHRQLEEQFQQAQKMEAVGRLAGGIAHDFNNLLTAIRGYTTLLADRLDDDSARADLNQIRNAAERAAQLTRQLLAFSRRQVVQLREIDASAVVRELQQLLRRLIPEDIALRTEFAHDCCVVADAGQLEQIVMNLVVNASDAGPRTGIDLRIAPVTVEGGNVPPGLEAGEYILLTVQDDGCGIESDVLPRVFEPFFTTKPQGKGTGLGLSMVYGVVQQSGGMVYIDSTPETGTTVRVYLPRVRTAEPVTAAEEMPERASPTERERILLVEDEPGVRTLAERVLVRQGYHVVTAANGVEALAEVGRQSDRLDLLLTDVVMPEMGGVQLAARLAERQPGLKVLFMSGYTGDELSLQEQHFLEKPFTPAGLVSAVRRTLESAAASS
jgi:two-component system, cell cycle sensor histidine kinase and response regulator CckA